DPSDPALGGRTAQSDSFWRLQARSDTRLSTRARWLNTLSVGRDHSTLRLGNNDVDTPLDPLALRSGVRLTLNEALSAVVGLDIQALRYDVSWRIPPLDIDRGVPEGPVFGRPLTTLQGKGDVLRPAGYALLELRPARGLKLLPSVRADYAEDTG